MTEPTKEQRQAALRLALARRNRVAVPRLESGPAKSTALPDFAAEKEAQAIASDDLPKESAKREFGRTERFKDHVAIAMLILFWIGFTVLLGCGIAWGINFFLPPEKAFITPEKASQIIGFLTGGGITSFVAGYAKKRLS